MNKLLKIIHRHQLVQVMLVGFALISLRFWKFYLGNTLLFGDNYSLMVPGKLFTADWLKQGVLPLWNPNIFAGISWIGDINQSIFYPSTLLFMIFHPAVALNVNVIIHLILSFVAMFYVTKQFVKSSTACYLSAILWSFSPQLVGTLNNISTFQSLSWMPVVVLAGLNINKKFGVAWLGLAVSAQLIGGYPQHVLYSVLVAFLLVIFKQFELPANKRKWLPLFFKWTTAGVISVCLTSFVWLPFIENIRQSTRAIQSPDQAASGSLAFAEFPKMLLPYLFDNPAGGIKWGVSWGKPPNLVLYFTWFGWLLIGWALLTKHKKKLDWLFLSIFMVSFIVALGNNTPFFGIFNQLPIINLTRGLSTILMIPALIGSIWVATIFDRVKFSKQQIRAILVISGLVVVGAVATLLIITVSFGEVWHFVNQIGGNLLAQSKFHTEARDFLIAQNIAINLVVNSSALLLSIYLFWKKRLSLLLFAVAIDMIFNTQAHLIFAQNKVYDASLSSEMKQVVTSADFANYRMLTRNYNSPYTDFGAYWDAVTVRPPFSESYIDEQELTDFNYLLRMRDGLTPNWNLPQNIPLINGYTTLLPLSIYEDFAKENEDPGINNLSQIMIGDPNLDNWAVRYYLVDTWFPSYDEVFPEKLVAEAGSWRLYENTSAKPRFRDELGNSLPTQIVVETPHRLDLEINDNSADVLIMADRFEPGWQATVNGEPAEVTDFQGQRQVKLKQGSNNVSLEYWPKSFSMGLVLSGFTLLLLVGFVGWETYSLKKS